MLKLIEPTVNLTMPDKEVTLPQLTLLQYTKNVGAIITQHTTNSSTFVSCISSDNMRSKRSYENASTA